MTLPTDYANLQAWYDASQHSGSDTDPVSTATDYGGAANHANAAGAERPLYRTNIFPTGKPAFDFDGSDDVLTMPGTVSTYTNAGAACSVFMAVIVGAYRTEGANWYNNEGILGDISNGHFNVLMRSTNPYLEAANYDGSTTALVDVTSPAAGTAFVYHMRTDSTNLYASVNGGTEVSAASGASSGIAGTMVLGRGISGLGGFFIGKIGEVFIYSAARSAGEVTALNQYLRDKWIAAYTGVPRSQPNVYRM